MYELEYNKDMKKYGVFRTNIYTGNRLLCGVFDNLESAILFIVNTINKEMDNVPYDRI